MNIYTCDKMNIYTCDKMNVYTCDEMNFYTCDKMNVNIHDEINAALPLRSPLGDQGLFRRPFGQNWSLFLDAIASLVLPHETVCLSVCLSGNQ